MLSDRGDFSHVDFRGGFCIEPGRIDASHTEQIYNYQGLVALICNGARVVLDPGYDAEHVPDPMRRRG